MPVQSFLNSEVNKIRELYQSGNSIESIALRYNSSYRRIKDIVNYRIYDFDHKEDPVPTLMVPPA